jgi:hypothetical protein
MHHGNCRDPPLSECELDKVAFERMDSKLR